MLLAAISLQSTLVSSWRTALLGMLCISLPALADTQLEPMHGALGNAVPPGAAEHPQPTAPENYCTRGLEHGKIIVQEIYLENHFRETTRLGCEVDGGTPVQMPDLPPPDVAKTRLA